MISREKSLLFMVGGSILILIPTSVLTSLLVISTIYLLTAFYFGGLALDHLSKRNVLEFGLFWMIGIFLNLIYLWIHQRVFIAGLAVWGVEIIWFWVWAYYVNQVISNLDIWSLINESADK